MADQAKRAGHKTLDFLGGQSRMAEHIAAVDWDTGPLGPIDTWPPELRTTVSLCLASNFPINIIWGDACTQIYNDGYAPLCGDRHPTFLGADYRECWASAWPAIGEPFKTAMAGASSFVENQRMFLTRNGYLEETFFTFSLSPIRDETGAVAGLFHPVTETTVQVLSERRQQLLHELTESLGEVDTTQTLYAEATKTFSAHVRDIPAVLFYCLQEESGDYVLSGSLKSRFGVSSRPEISPELISCLNSPLRIEDATDWFPAGTGPYEEDIDTAILVPLCAPGKSSPTGLALCATSTRLPLNKSYMQFYSLLQSTLEKALSRVLSAQAERLRTEKLADLERARTQFFANISHEFRTPLTLMLGPLAEALEEQQSGQKLSPQQHERVEIAHRNAVRLLKLVNMLLTFSKTVEGQTTAKFRLVNLGALTLDISSHFRSACEQAGLEFDVRALPIQDDVFVDPDLWEMIVLNLLSNAFKFTFVGGIKLKLEPAGRHLKLTVCDSGVGIQAEDLPLVFERFRQVHGQKGRTIEGSGIGLALTRELVELHCGSIELESEPGKGSTFTVLVPSGKSHLPPEQIVQLPGQTGTVAEIGTDQSSHYAEEVLSWLPGESMTTSAAPSPDETRKAPRVLLADDNADMRAYIVRILTEEG